MKLTVDGASCMGHGRCYQLAPDLLDVRRRGLRDDPRPDDRRARRPGRGRRGRRGHVPRAGDHPDPDDRSRRRHRRRPVRLLRRRPAAQGRASRSTCSTRCRRRTGSCAPASRPTTRRSSRSRGCTTRPPQHPGFRFFGGVELGADVTREELLERYHAVVYAVGTPTDNRLGIPGDDRPGSVAATEFVAWYNGHPDYADDDVRPVVRARRRDRQRQRRDRRRADAGARPRRARADRHRRPRDRGVRRRLGHARW